MELLGPVDWGKVFLPQTPLLETLVRGSVTYLALFALMRFTFKREAGGTSITTLLVVVLMADAAQNAMADDYTSVTDGVLLVTAILAWSFFLDWLGSRVPALATLTHSAPLPLVKDGRLLRRNMRRELISEEELWTQLRHQNVHSLEEVESAYMEGDGQVSILKRDRDGAGRRRGRPPGT